MDGLNLGLRRLLFALPVIGTTAAAVHTMYAILSPMGMTVAEWGMLVLFSLSFVWIAIWFWNSLLGCIIRAVFKDPEAAASPILASLNRKRPITARTALVMPVYNEDPERTCRRLEATYRSIEAEGSLERFDFFLLSDTTDLAIAEQEIASFARLKRLLNPNRLHYRRREQNIGRKAGNIADFGRRWGRDYDFMVVLDADSVMSGRLVTDLTRMMEANADAGIIQTVPRPILAETLFGRLQQFGSRATAEVVNTGVGFWQMSDGNYFGHNAIIRTAAFFDHCDLPVLKGKGPLSGEIMSHDFVEAAFIRRAGYKVWNIPIGEGSYEEIPPTLIDYVKRDRRWCQGNLQHTRVLPQRGLKPLSRFHLAAGVMSYVASPLWFLFILMSVINLIHQSNPGLAYRGPGSESFTLYPGAWNLMAIELFCAIMAMLILPKVMGAMLLAADASERRRYGGFGGLFVSSMIEVAASVILAPVMMVFQTGFVASILSGISVRWDAQTRDSRRIGLVRALRSHATNLAFGFLLAAVVLTLAPQSLIWFLPLILGPLLSPLLTTVTSSRKLGYAFARNGLFMTPEETSPAAEIQPLRETAVRDWEAPLADGKTPA